MTPGQTRRAQRNQRIRELNHQGQTPLQLAGRYKLTKTRIRQILREDGDKPG